MLNIEPLLAFLTAGSKAEVEVDWEKGPTGNLYRKNEQMALAEYVLYLGRLEASSGLSGQTVKQIVQRLRRLHFSKFILQSRKQGYGPLLCDLVIKDCTDYDDPPLTTDHVDKATLEALWNCGAIVTARGLQVDIAHVWMLVDMALSGLSTFIHDPYSDNWPGTFRNGSLTQDFSDSHSLMTMFSWGGDFGSALNLFWSESIRGNDRSRTHRIRAMQTGLGLVSKMDLLGDVDSIVLAHEAYERNAERRLKVSELIHDYYKDDLLPQAEAMAMNRPCSVRRFHYFLAGANKTPSDVFETLVVQIPSERISEPDAPLVMTVDRDELVSHFKDFLAVCMDDVDPTLGLFKITSTRIDNAGRDLYDKLCKHFAEFLIKGLETGDALWPPTNWD